MNNFSWFKAIGFGILIWAIMFLLAAILVAAGITIGIGWSLALALAIGVVAYSFALSADSAGLGQAFGYGLLWAIIGIALDLIITRQFQDNLFSMWTYWVGYALVFFAPWFEYELQGSGGGHPRAV